MRDDDSLAEVVEAEILKRHVGFDVDFWYLTGLDNGFVNG